MNIVQQDWFSSPVWYCMLDHDNDSIEKYIRHLTLTENSILRSNYNGSWHSRTLSDTENESIKDLLNKTLKITKMLCEKIGVKDYYEPIIDTFWANVNPQASFNAPHTHPESFFSAVYYVKANKNGNIVFQRTSELERYMWQTYTYNNNQTTNAHVEYQALTGKLLIFPSWVPHMVSENEIDEDRISLAINIKLKDTRI